MVAFVLEWNAIVIEHVFTDVAIVFPKLSILLQAPIKYVRRFTHDMTCIFSRINSSKKHEATKDGRIRAKDLAEAVKKFEKESKWNIQTV